MMHIHHITATIKDTINQSCCFLLLAFDPIILVQHASAYPHLRAPEEVSHHGRRDAATQSTRHYVKIGNTIINRE